MAFRSSTPKVTTHFFCLPLRTTGYHLLLKRSKHQDQSWDDNIFVRVGGHGVTLISIIVQTYLASNLPNSTSFLPRSMPINPPVIESAAIPWPGKGEGMTSISLTSAPSLGTFSL